MSSPLPTPQHQNFGEAFCAGTRCSPKSYERKVFWKTLNRSAIVPVLLSGGLDQKFFQKDLETIRAMAEVRTEEDMDRVLDEFSSLNSVERGVWRGQFKLRLSGERLAELYRKYASTIKVPEIRTPMMAPKLEKPLNQPDFDQISVSTDGGLASKDAKVVVLRKLKRAHEEITGGRNVEEVLRDHAFTREQFEQALIEAPTSRTELSWLRDYLSGRRELEHLRIENTQLKSAIADLSVKLNTRS